MALQKNITVQANPSDQTAENPTPDVARCTDIGHAALTRLLQPYALTVNWIGGGASIPGSHFGEPEAGLIGGNLYVRDDTPIHSALHESCHYICMDSERRQALHTDAGGDYDEENAVCYLSILLADQLENYDRNHMMQDMDRWGYTFRLGSARKWFEQDAGDAQKLLLQRGIIDHHDRPTWSLAQTPLKTSTSGTNTPLRTRY